MAELRDRMMRAAVFTDIRLLNVSREARLLALALDNLAEATGVMDLEPRAIRAPLGYFLGVTDEPAKLTDIASWTDELIAAWWIVPYDAAGRRLGYLKGFGERQTGHNVGVGISKETGEVKPHLPLPPGQICVTLDTESDCAAKWTAANKARPLHCDLPYTKCEACEWRRAFPIDEQAT